MHQFAEVILPLPFGTTFTYGIPLEFQEAIAIGMRVEVPFAKKLQSGIVASLHNNKPDAFAVQSIKQLIDVVPILQEKDIAFWQWISNYYMCSIGDVMASVVPAHLKLSSETALVLNPQFAGDMQALNDAEYMLVEALQLREQITLEEAQSIVQPKPIRKIIAGMVQSGILLAYETLKDAYKPKTEDIILLTPTYNDEKSLQSVFTELERAPKQLHLLLHILHLQQTEQIVRKKKAIEESGTTAAQVQALAERGIITVSTRQIDRVVLVANKHYEKFELSKEQQQALSHIQAAQQSNTATLLHGITGSGKTNVLMKHIESVLQQGKQVLYLVPEIALTAQLINRLYSYFGDALGVYHSRYSNNERVETWQNIGSGKIKILLGARSALFLPFNHLGLVIVDEEHDSSYKQFDTAPRYNARDASLVLAKLNGAQVVLTSATPSIESYHNAQLGKYKLVTLTERYGEAALPEILLVDNKVLPGTTRQSPLLSDILIDAMKHTMMQRKQVILFQNRRGFAPHLYCSLCGWHAVCNNCDVNVTYHKHTDKLHCHTCGSKTAVYKTCPKCKGDKLYYKNYGTERVEEEVQRVFPKAVLDRLDTDTARTKNKFQAIIKGLEHNHTQVLIGTQMVAKGLDFTNVQTVGVINADSLYSIPEYRVNERAFQLLSQVSGRAGRQDKNGLVLIQYTNAHNMRQLQLVQEYNYSGFYEGELAHRQELGYPPFVRLLKISIRHRQQAVVHEVAALLATKLVHIKEILVLGPSEPPIARRNNYYYEDILVKCGTSADLLKYVKHHLGNMITQVLQGKGRSGVGIVVDVDP
ncbi:MAG: primosomal protein [Bacteroidota bacterium]